MRFSLRNRLYGPDILSLYGWLEVKCRQQCLSVGLENRSKMMRPSSDLMTRKSRTTTCFSENSMVNFMFYESYCSADGTASVWRWYQSKLEKCHQYIYFFLNGTNPCIYPAIHMLLMHSFFTRILEPLQKLTSSTVMCKEVNII